MAYECNICGEKFETGRGLHIHQSKIHSDAGLEETDREFENENKESKKSAYDTYIDTYIPGADELLKHGIWKKSVNLIAGNPGSEIFS